MRVGGRAILFPVTPGHTLVVPKRHVASIFDLPEPEYRELWAQVAKVRSLLVEKFHPSPSTSA
jgi:diadenosine tetraphosphate (Ap4A) HIT family hydrolase